MSYLPVSTASRARTASSNIWRRMAGMSVRSGSARRAEAGSVAASAVAAGACPRAAARSARNASTSAATGSCVENRNSAEASSSARPTSPGLPVRWIDHAARGSHAFPRRPASPWASASVGAGADARPREAGGSAGGVDAVTTRAISGAALMCATPPRA